MKRKKNICSNTIAALKKYLGLLLYWREQNTSHNEFIADQRDDV